MDTIILLTAIVLALIILIWLGLSLKPAAYPQIRPQTEKPKTIPLPQGLPAPVERFYRQAYGENLPVITSACLTGHGWMAPFGIRFPLRFRFIYEVGKDYRASLEATFYRRPVMTGEETCIDGHAYGKLTTGISEGPWFDDAMNLRVWIEILTWFPAALFSDRRVTWDPVDDETALLVVPFGEKQQKIVVRFDPVTGKVRYVEAMKYRDAGHKVLWINAIWFDQGKPWVRLDVDELVFNGDVQGMIRGKGR